LVSWRLVFTKHAQKDAQKLAASGLKAKAQELLAILQNDPFQNPPSFEKLVGDLAGAYSRRINIQHRLVYQVLANEKVVKVLRMWTHYSSHRPPTQAPIALPISR
jgi:toxin YoeB